MTLRVKLEIVPFGDEDKAYEIGRLDIFNKGLDPSGYFHQYGVINLSPSEEGLYKEVVMHRRLDGAWRLVSKVIDRLQIEGPKK